MTEALAEMPFFETEPTDNPEQKPNDSGPAVDLVRIYLKDLGEDKLIGAEQEVNLAKRIEAGLAAGRIAVVRATPRQHRSEADLEFMARFQKFAKTPAQRQRLTAVEADGARAQQELIEANLRLVVKFAKPKQGKGLDFLDLIQEGNVGLIRAVEKFDFTKGYKFSTYAPWWIKKFIKKAILEQVDNIRIPEGTGLEIIHVEEERADLSKKHGRAATDQEVADSLKMKLKKVIELQQLANRKTQSLDAPYGTNYDTPLAEHIREEIDDPLIRIDETLDRGILSQVLSRALAALPELSARDHHAMRLRFGLEDGKPWTLVKTGREIGVNVESARQIERKVIELLSADRQTRDIWEQLG